MSAEKQPDENKSRKTVIPDEQKIRLTVKNRWMLSTLRNRKE